jgi:hypothetical protein
MDLLLSFSCDFEQSKYLDCIQVLLIELLTVYLFFSELAMYFTKEEFEDTK